MQNPYKNIGKSSFISEKLGILSENSKILTSSNYPRVQHFFAETLQTFPTY